MVLIVFMTERVITTLLAGKLLVRLRFQVVFQGVLCFEMAIAHDTLELSLLVLFAAQTLLNVDGEFLLSDEK